MGGPVPWIQIYRMVIDRVIQRKGVRASSVFIITISTDFEASPPLTPSFGANDSFRLGVSNLRQSTFVRGAKTLLESLRRKTHAFQYTVPYVCLGDTIVEQK